MFLLYVFARVVSRESEAVTSASTVLLWSVVGFFCLFLALTASAVVFAWPAPWVSVLGLGVSRGTPFASRDFVIGKWRAYQSLEDGTDIEFVVTYRPDGTCVAYLSQTVKSTRNPNGLNDNMTLRDEPCTWDVKIFSDTTLRLSVSYPIHPQISGTTDFEVVGANRSRHIGAGKGGDYTAERLE